MANVYGVDHVVHFFTLRRREVPVAVYRRLATEDMG